MTTEGYIAALERRHQELDRQIQTEAQNRLADDLMVAALKRKKLEVKDELYKLQGAMRQ
ncbi:YdcH family protein [Devosia sp. YIM 151766]|uniref:YdcH family protein n=1 Tax=Devosia sp. YIM 151766 TaxID=3017325 RepID=UPI00255CBC0E|nr:YdcH family protein [Devosia sp. YIM 151766]WIY52315.1 YdcH family protein [Devosia sp. YIM 151766]